MTLIRETIIVLRSSIPISRRYCRRLSKKTNFGKLDMNTKVFFRVVANDYQPKSKVRNQNLSKTIDDFL